ncbi:MAG TPA: hypothetical protein VFO73_05280 [Candidatus Limnocylindrales bacterium]|nr:hypothetical protein [Candidatus Limnocylindrales bacterium]
MRSLFAGLAAAWFAYHALSFLPPTGVYLNDGAPGGLDGDPGAVAITYAARALFVGMTLIAVALVEWGWLLARAREANDRQKNRRG